MPKPEDIIRAKEKLKGMELEREHAGVILTDEAADEALVLGWVEGLDFYRMMSDRA